MSPIEFMSIGFVIGVAYIFAGILATLLVDGRTEVINKYLNKGIWWPLIFIVLWCVVLPPVCLYAIATHQWSSRY